MEYSRPTRSIDDLDRARRLLGGAVNPHLNENLRSVIGKPAPKPLVNSATVDATTETTAIKTNLTPEQQAVANANKAARAAQKAAADAASQKTIEDAAASGNSEPVAPVKGKPVTGHVVHGANHTTHTAQAATAAAATTKDNLLT